MGRPMRPVVRTLSFVVPGKPQPKERPRVARGRAYTPKRTSRYEGLVALTARMAMAQSGNPAPFEGPVGLRLTVLLPRPHKIGRSHVLYGRQGRVHTGAGGSLPDLSNVCKAVEDGLNGVLFQDDSQVCHLEAHKCYAGEDEEAGVLVDAWTFQGQ